MSVADELRAGINDLHESYEAVKATGTAVDGPKNFDNLPHAIAQIDAAELEGYPFPQVESVSDYPARQYKIWGNSEQGIPAEGYTVLEYATSTGTQFFNSGYTITQDTTVEFKGYSPNWTGYFFASGVFGSHIDLGLLINTSNGYYRVRRKQNTSNEDFTSDVLADTTPRVFSVGRTVKIDGEVVETFTNTGNFQGTCPLGIFALNSAGTPSTYKNDGTMYYLKIFEGDKLMRYFVPVRRNSDDAIGLFEVVERKFYENLGTGSLVAGPDLPNTPTPVAPLEIKSVGSSPNLCPIKDFTVNNGPYWYYLLPEPIPAGTYTISLSVTSNDTDTNTCLMGLAVASDGTDLIGAQFTRGVRNAHTITTTKTANYLLFYSSDKYAHGAGDTAVFTDIQIEAGSEATPYTPYGKYAVPITVKSEQEYSIYGHNTGHYLDANGDTVSNSNWRISGYMPVKAGKTYAYTGVTNAGTSPRSVWYNSDKEFISSFQLQAGDNTVVAPEGAAFIRCSVYNTTAVPDYKHFVFYQGSLPQTTTIILDEPLRKIGDYTDYIDYKKQQLVRNIGSVSITGTDLTYVSGGVSWAEKIPMGAYKTTAAGELSLVMSDKLKAGESRSSLESVVDYNQNETIALGDTSISATYSRLYVKTDQTWSQENVETLFADPIDVLYVLSTPTEETISLPPLERFEGELTITIDTDAPPSNAFIKL